MAGKRILDAALLANATRAVAKQHLRIRGDQLDVWSRTSTVAKAVKNQTDRVTLTAQAASALARRFNESVPAASSAAAYNLKSQRANDDASVPRTETVDDSGSDRVQREGVKQDHHYKRSEQNAVQDGVPARGISVQQEMPERYPTQDGSIPPEGAPVGVPESDAQRLSGGQRAEQVPTKDPLSGEGEASAEISPQSSPASTIPDPRPNQTSEIPQNEVIPEQEEIPEGINTDVFHSPRVSKLLGAKNKNDRDAQDMEMKGSKGTPIDTSKQSEGRDQETFNVREAGSKIKAVSHAAASGTEAANAGERSCDSEDIQDLASDIAKETSAEPPMDGGQAAPLEAPHEMHESRVPSSRFGRLWEYGGLATSMAFGAVGETFRRATGSASGQSLMLSAANMERLVAKLSKMRGAALKLGQMMSFQDSKMLPAPIHQVLMRVQDNADYMPAFQRNQVLSSNLGPDWRSLFDSFEEKPMAAASIGQVHKATLASSRAPVAVKIQYPGVATSISSDLNNLSILLTASRLLPKGLFLDKTIANARTELAWECDYVREAECQTRFKELLAGETDVFTVPAIIKDASGPQVLTAELMSGVGVTKSSLQLSQSERDWIGTQIMRLCLRELTEFNFMQTDPNWTNFLYNASSRKLELLDFGAARDFPDKFVTPYVRLLIGASNNDRAVVRDLSIELGYLTGQESQTMLDAHIASVMTLAEPFRENRNPDDAYDFRDQTITDRVRGLIPVMIRERLAPPPEETYSLHRKLSGAFLLLARLGSQVKCRDLFVDAIRVWKQKQSLQAV